MLRRQPLPCRLCAGARVDDTMPDVPEVTEPALAVEAKERRRSSAPLPPAARKPPPQPSSNGGATSILTPEESEAAAREAMAKLQQAQQQGGAPGRAPGGRDRPGSTRRTLWFALAGARSALWRIVALIIGLLSTSPSRRFRAAPPGHPRGAEDDRPPPRLGAAERKRRPEETRERKAGPKPLRQKADPPRARSLRQAVRT